jgi:hypothetical protein
MNIIQVNNSLSNYIIYNIKSVNDDLIEENALHAKNKLRSIRDQTTDTFIETMFKYDFNQSILINNNKTVKRNLFLLFVYDYFNLNLTADFNCYLMANNCVILNNSTEYIHFLFKGGNILFMYINNLIQTQNLFAHLTADEINKVNLLFTEYFKVSDFDFGIYLKTDTNEKFTMIKKYLLKFLISRLEELNLFFNSYLIDSLNVNTLNINKKISSQLINGSYNFNYTDNLPIVIPPKPIIERLNTVSYTHLRAHET